MLNLSNYVGLRLLVHDGNCGECVAGREIGIFTGSVIPQVGSRHTRPD